MKECKYCKKEFSIYGLKNHEIYCKHNPDRKSRSGKNNPNFGNKGKKSSNQFIKAKNEGITIKTSEETKKKISEKIKGRKLTEAHKNAISKSMKRVVIEKPESYSSSNVNGRVNKVNYKGIILDSEWERIFAIWLDEKEIKWERPLTGFKYQWEGERIYYPDFYLPEYDLYIEVKGYTRERDIAKWRSLNNLKVIKRKDINKIKKGEFKL